MRALALSLMLFTGCAATKQEIGDYVKEAVIASVEASVDKKLAERGLSLSEIKNSVDLNKDNKVTGSEVYVAFKETAKDAAILEAKKLVDDKLAQLQSHVASKDEISSSLWHYAIMGLLTMVSGFLGKQVHDTKHNTTRDHRIAMLEKALNTDLDGDGEIGEKPQEPKQV